MRNGKYISSKCLVVLALVSSASFSQIPASKWPAFGSLYYDGQLYADADMEWISPGAWGVSSPKYEHDLVHYDVNYFTGSCTSFTTLPAAYDDCDTAGFSDGGNVVYTFGSFQASQIQTNTSYWGAWSFGGFGGPTVSSASLNGQVGRWAPWCPFPEVDGWFWCVKAADSDIFITRGSGRIQFNRNGIPSTVYWNR